MNRPGCSSRMSIGSHELSVQQARWDLAQRYIEEAEQDFQRGRLDEALKKCDSALSMFPDLVPALQLQKRIKKAGSSAKFDGNEDPELSTEDYGNDRLLERGFYEADISSEDSTSMAPLSRQPYKDYNAESRNRGPVVSTPLLKQDQKKRGILRTPESKQVRFGEPNAPGPKLTVLRDTGRQKKLEDLLLKGHYGEKPAVEILNELDVLLWSVWRNSFQCPDCHVLFADRWECYLHFVNFHFNEDPKGIRIRPFACRTCGDPFRDARCLVKHTEKYHPQSRFLLPLRHALGIKN